MLSDPTDPAVSPETRSQPSPKQPRAKCAECGESFIKVRPHQVFCCSKHLRAYQNRLQVEGRAIVALAKAWRVSRNAKGSSPDAVAARETGNKALSELSSILDGFIAADKADGRADPISYARTLLNNQAGRYIDRQRSR